MSNWITEQDVRDYVGEQVAKGDLAFEGMELTTAQIAAAMKSAAREWNSIPPYVCNLHASRLPSDTNALFDAIAMHLMMQERQRLTKEDIDYASGGVSINLVQKRIAHLEKMIPIYDRRFQEAAQAMKIHINLNHAYGTVG